MDLSEVERRTERLDRDIAALSSRMTMVETSHTINDVHRDNVERRLTGIEDTLKWIVRLILGAIILALIGFALAGGFRP